MRRTPLARKTGMRTTAKLRRSRRMPLVNRPRKSKMLARNFGEEADRVRTMPCLVTGTAPSEPAHVTSRGAGGGRFDLVPLSPELHREQHSIGIESFAAKYGLDLRAEADRIAVEHPETLGIRGLARRWEVWHRLEAGDAVEAHELLPALDAHETAALLGWVRRRMERAAAFVPNEWAKLCSQIQGHALGLAKFYEGHGWRIGAAYFTGEEWVYTAARPDREALASDLMMVFGWEMLDSHGELGRAWTLCELAGWP